MHPKLHVVCARSGGMLVASQVHRCFAFDREMRTTAAVEEQLGKGFAKVLIEKRIDIGIGQAVAPGQPPAGIDQLKADMLEDRQNGQNEDGQPAGKGEQVDNHIGLNQFAVGHDQLPRCIQWIVFQLNVDTLYTYGGLEKAEHRYQCRQQKHAYDHGEVVLRPDGTGLPFV